MRAEGVVAGIFGLVSFGISAALFSAAKSGYNKSNRPGLCENDVCTSEGLNQRAGARTAADFATATFVTGFLLLGSGVTLFVLAPSYQQTVVGVETAPGGLRLRGSF